MLAINLFVSDSQENLEKLLQAAKFNEVSLIAGSYIVNPSSYIAIYSYIAI